MKYISLDPRFSRIELPGEEVKVELQAPDSWQTYEVFHQKKKGVHHSHVGIVHAPNQEMALVLAKEQFSRRGQTTSLWVVKSSDIIATEIVDEDIFETTPEKLHREAGMYKTRDKIEEYINNKNV